MEVQINTEGKSMKTSRVLIVDDDRMSGTILEDILKAQGYETVFTDSSAEGFKLIKDWDPSVVLLDLVMPGMDGITLCREVRAAELPHRPSIIIVSSKSDRETVIKALSEGADDFIAKPVDEAEVIARVKAQKRIHDFYRETEEDNQNLQAILDISAALSATLDSNEVLDIIVARVAMVTEAVRCSIVLISKEDEGYVIASHEDPNLREFRVDLSKYPEIQEVIHTKAPLVVDDMASHPIMTDVKKSITGLDHMSLVIVPIVFSDEVLGTLFLRTKKKEGFTKKELDFCKIVANTSYFALKNARLFEKITREREYLREIAVKDQLTNLYNHNFFYSRLDEEFERAVRYETPLSLIMLDIDNFKEINDTYGHRVGDAVLREIAVMIKKGVRKTDVVARYGGEEFAVILPHTLLKGAVEEAERIRELIEAHAYAGLVEKVTVSIGVASYPQKGAMNSGDLVNYADDALYRAKWSGKNCVKVAE